MFNIVKYRWYYITFSLMVIVPGIIAMIFSTITTGSPVQLGIDFVGGSLFELQFEGDATEGQIREVFAEFDMTDIVLQELVPIGDENVENASRWQARTAFAEPEVTEAIKLALSDQIAPLNEDATSVVQVTPTIGAEVTQAAIVAVFVATAVILGFIVFAFRQVPNALRYGVCAITAMIHDILVVMGVMSILGLLFGWEVDALFLTAMLTVIGFSVQDSIVVFDRIRENTRKRRGEAYEMLVNRSLLETVHRSLATQLNAFFIMMALLLFGGDTIKQFVAILFIGLASGTYSSIFNAVPLLVIWENGELPFLRGNRRRQQSAA
ncbi:MAG: protein translocase subunit SecF [Anaerolineae bacterium]|nr:protein translocase subunit SecF [Anaerolineae bacterium]